MLALNVTDALTTQFLVRGNLGREANPLILTWAGQSGFLALKIGGVLVAAIILLDIHKRYPQVAFWSACFFALAYLGIVVWNVSIIGRM